MTTQARRAGSCPPRRHLRRLRRSPGPPRAAVSLRRTDGKDMRPRRDGGCSLCCSRSCSGAGSPRLSQQPAMLSHAQFHRSGSR
jgi:hypothetical protein